MDKSFLNPQILRGLGLFGLGLLLNAGPTDAVAGDIADTPLLAYPGGTRHFLFILGNDCDMGKPVGASCSGGSQSGSSKSSLVSQAISPMFTDASTLMGKVTASGQVVGMGLMTYGGSSAKSPYIWPTSTYSPTYYQSEISKYCPSPSNLFYVNPSPNSHPYCLPVSLTRPVSYQQSNGSCSAAPVTGKYCYLQGGKTVAAQPAMGRLWVPIDNSPKPSDTKAASTRAGLFTDAISTAGNSGGNAIEGALLTACDYFNTSWVKWANSSSTNSKSRCYRGYAPGPSGTAPSNVFSDPLQGYTAQIPRFPKSSNDTMSCNASIVLITDKLQDTTADGITYTPNFSVTEKNPGTSPASDLLSPTYVGGLTDPVLVALNNLYQGNKGTSIRTYVVGLGVSSKGTTATNFNKLAIYGFNSSTALAYFPSDSSSLTTAFDNILSDAFFTPPPSSGSSGASAATNSTTVQADTLVFLAQFNYIAGWVGDLQAYPLDATNLTLGPQAWDASDNLATSIGSNASNVSKAASRPVYSYDAWVNPPKKVSFQCASFSSTTQKSVLGCTSGNSSNLINWVRGDSSKENSLFRSRNGLILGDISSSSPVYTSTENFVYDALPEGTISSSTPYQTFLNDKANRKPMIYVGSNDGMLHGFTVGTSPSYSDGGVENFAYLPNAVIGKLQAYADLPKGGTYYPHVYFVDGPPAVGDACLPSGPNCTGWKTVLVETTGVGAKAVFALDITCGSASGASCGSGFTASNVMWEISDSDASACTPVCGDTKIDTNTSVHKDLGYTASQASIVRLNNGKWAAIVANGYNSANGKAVLFILDLANGSVIKKLDTKRGKNSVVAANGLSSPIVIDVDGNRTADYVYAGDLEGNVWKFDITASDSSQWAVSSTPVFVACAPSGTSQCKDDADRQPITSKPDVGLASAQGQNGVGVMVYVGTGKYFELGDNVVPNPLPTKASQQIESFYAFWDNATGSQLGRGDLVAQTIDTQIPNNGNVPGIRTSSKNVVDYTKVHGWYMDLVPNGATPNGERIVQHPIVESSRVLFETLIPNSQALACLPGGSSWIMELDPRFGWPVQGVGWTSTPSASGLGSIVGVATSPAIVTKSDGSKIRVYSGSSPNNGVPLQIFPPDPDNSTGRQQGRVSWTQIQ